MARKQVDWEAIEKEYTLGQKSLRVIAKEFDTTAGTISKRAKKENWYQDKSEEVRRKTQAALLKETLNGNRKRNTPTRDDIEGTVRTNIQVITNHRKTLKYGHKLIEKLFAQLEETVENRSEIEQEIKSETASEGLAGLNRRRMMLRSVSLPSNAGILKDLSAALKSLIPLERQAFNLDTPGANIEDVIAALPDKFRDGVRAALTDAVS